MTDTFRPLEIHKTTLSNGLTVLVRPNKRIPRVDIQMWYGVGSRDEHEGQRGMAHLLEHMLFKGTKLLSETDINVITHKLGGESNAFTTHDYTCYTYRFPTPAWTNALPLLAECMVNARLDEQMLASELRTVVEELRMYRDDYQNCLIEQMMEVLFVGHPYQHPIIGTKHDLCGITPEHLKAFYKKYYHPTNAVLLVAGDVSVDEVVTHAEKTFGTIKGVKNFEREKTSYLHDLVQRNVTMYRPTKTPWCVYAYKIPGFCAAQNHIFDIAALVLANGRSSRLYERLVNKERSAFDVECSVYDFHEHGLFVITVYPVAQDKIGEIEKVIQDELEKLATRPVTSWEFKSAQKRTLMDYGTLLESNEKQAMLIGSSYMATGDEQFINTYFKKIQKITTSQIRNFFATWCLAERQNKGCLLPIIKGDRKVFSKLQDDDNELEKQLLERTVRTSPIEPEKLALQVRVPDHQSFHFPTPQEAQLSNGLEVMWYNNPHVPQILMILNFKVFAGYDPDGKDGRLAFLLRTMTDATKKRDSAALSKYLECEGISLIPFTDGIGVRCLSGDVVKAMELLKEILLMPAFAQSSIEKVRGFICNELDEYWDTPIDCIDQIAKEHLYKNHPYRKYPWGNKKSITAMTLKDLKECYKTNLSPRGAQLVIVGDLPSINVRELVEKHLGAWDGPVIEDLEFPQVKVPCVKNIVKKMHRDQVALAFVAPSLSRLDKDYYAAAVLDTVVTGAGAGMASSRLFSLREQTGLFYGIGGSLLYQAKEQQGLVLIKTIVSPDKTKKAQELVLKTLHDVKKNGITADEFDMARRHIIAASVELFENNMQIALTFLFLKKYKLSFNLFDKLIATLSILKLDDVKNVAKQLCAPEAMTVIKVGK